MCDVRDPVSTLFSPQSHLTASPRSFFSFYLDLATSSAHADGDTLICWAMPMPYSIIKSAGASAIHFHSILPPFDAKLRIRYSTCFQEFFSTFATFSSRSRCRWVLVGRLRVSRLGSYRDFRFPPYPRS